VPLPLPNLDARRWADLVDEGRALVPRLAPGWDDHNASDPGITLMELLAWLVEHDLYRVNRVPERHRRKFLALLGFTPLPPRPAAGTIVLTAAAGATPTLPAGLAAIAIAAPGAPPLAFRTLAPLAVAGVRIAAVQSFDGAAFADRTRLWRDGLPVPAWGAAPIGFGDPDAERRPALLVGLDAAPPAGAPLSLWVRVDTSGATAAEPGTEHHSLRTVWEVHDGVTWQPAPAADATRALTQDGAVVVTVPATAPARIGAVADPLVWLRARADAGRPDTAPVLLDLQVNAVAVQQRAPVRQSFAIAAGAPPPVTAPVPGRMTRLRLAIDAHGVVQSLDAGAAPPVPEAVVLAYVPATALAAGELVCTLALAGVSTGAPWQRLELEPAPVCDGALRLWTLEGAGAAEWERRDDLDAAGFADRVFTLDPQAGIVRFGDGRRGRVPEADAPILVAYDVTAAGSGSAPPGASWRLEDAVADAQIDRIASAGWVSGGEDAEDVPHAAGRAAEAMWSHERLVELAPAAGATLDGLDGAVVRGVVAPARAATALDFERLALAVPGTRVHRARAWPRIDARHPSLRAPGHVTVVIVPGWPLDRPEPGPQLLAAVGRFLGARRTLGTRLEVTGPRYVEVAVRATLRTLPGAGSAAAAAAAAAAVREHLHPLRGGPDGRGWPFGRDVRRTELLAVLDAAPGIDYVIDLELTGADAPGGCGDVCLGPLSLVTVTRVDVEALP
jgi:predicted phage baseplate assembly protein